MWPRGKAWIGEAVKASVAMVPEAGHYPQSHQPELTAETVLSRLATLNPPHGGQEAG
jgi:hypothetical protein